MPKHSIFQGPYSRIAFTGEVDAGVADPSSFSLAAERVGMGGAAFRRAGKGGAGYVVCWDICLKLLAQKEKRFQVTGVKLCEKSSIKCLCECSVGKIMYKRVPTSKKLG